MVLSRRKLLGWLAISGAAGRFRLAEAAEEAEWPVKAKIQAISNFFEVGRAEPDYAYVQNLNDGRGFTVTQYGFCTYNTEVTMVIELLLAASPDTPLKAFIPFLPPLGDGVDMDALNDFPIVWQKEATRSDLLPRLCDKVADALIYHPALTLSAAAHVTSPIGHAIFYDTLLQHGDSSDEDSFGRIYADSVVETRGVQYCGETKFLAAFLEIRRSVLLDPANHNTASVWQESVFRVDALQHLLKTNPTLIRPIKIRYNGIEQVIL